jgi:hypothetical protein
MDTEEEISIADEYVMLSCHKKFSHSSEDSTHMKEEWPESGTWQTRTYRDVNAALPFTYLTARMATPNTTCNSKPLELLQLFIKTVF